MREEISKILVKWSMPTRQAAISELVSLFQSEMEKVIGKNERPKKFAPDWPWNWRNQLRAEQRQKLSDLINTIEEVSKR